MICARPPTAGSRDLSGREGCAQAHRDEHIENLVGHGRDEWLDGAGEEFSEGKCLGGIAAKRVRGLRGIEVGKHGLIEAQVGPARQEAEDSEEEGGEGEKRRQGEHQHQAEVEKGKAWDT